REAVRRGVRVAIGHTEATSEQAASAVTAGASLVTHLFNAMPPVQARVPGTAGAALAGTVPFASIIADGVHVHPANVTAAVRSMGAGRLVLVTDAMPPVGTDTKTFDLQGRRVVVRDGACYLNDGTLAGSVLTMSAAVRNIRRMTGVPDAEAVAMASANPARALGIDNRKGGLAAGMDADVAICSPDFDVLLTMVEGQIVYRSPSWESVSR
ncbi:MAG: amidohydrolase family protein, partial [Dehalococcoidia bacterium]